MRFSRFFIDRPIFAAVLSVVIFIAGTIAIFALPVSEYPEVVPPSIVVRAIYPGANPRVLAEAVATPLEEQVNGVENMLYMSSQGTADGVLTLTVTFRVGTDVDLAQVQVPNRVSQALPRLLDEREFGDVIVKAGADGEVTRLRDVARIELAAGDYALRSMLDNKEAVAIAIFQAPGSNALQLSSAVRATMAELQKNFPDGVEHRVVYDPTINVRDGIREVVKTLFEAILLVVLVVVLFLQTWRASVIPLVAVPISIVGTFAILLSFGFSINTLSLFGLVLAIGIVVDDAIVVVENVERNIEAGLSPRDASYKA